MRDWADSDLLDQPAETLLAVRGVTKMARDKTLLRNVSFEIKTGRCLAIMGPNGAGKSLLCRILHGLVPLDAGQLMWRGAALNKAARSRQAMVFQNPVLLRRSVRANLRFALSVRGWRGADRRAREERALALSGLETRAQQPARVLSGGEQQRLALARAMICAPELLFLDEPTASLDPASTLAIERLIRTAQEAGTTIVLITHDNGQARRVAQDLVFLQDGAVAESGPLHTCLDAPRSAALQAWCAGALYVPSDRRLAAE